MNQRVEDPHAARRGLVDQYDRFAEHAVTRECVLLVRIAAEDSISRFYHDPVFRLLDRRIDLFGEHARVGLRFRSSEGERFAGVDGDLDGDGIGVVATVLVVVADLDDEPFARLDPQHPPRLGRHAAPGRFYEAVDDGRDVAVEVSRREGRVDHASIAGIAGHRLVDVGRRDRLAAGDFQVLVAGQRNHVDFRRDKLLIGLFAKHFDVADGHRVAEILVDHQPDVPYVDRLEAELPRILNAFDFCLLGREPGVLRLQDGKVEVGRQEPAQSNVGRTEIRSDPCSADRPQDVGRGGKDGQVVRAGRKPHIGRSRAVTERQFRPTINHQGRAGAGDPDPRSAGTQLDQLAVIHDGEGFSHVLGVPRLRPGQLLDLGFLDGAGALCQLDDLLPIPDSGVIAGVDAAFHLAALPGDGLDLLDGWIAAQSEPKGAVVAALQLGSHGGTIRRVGHRILHAGHAPQVLHIDRQRLGRAAVRLALPERLRVTVDGLDRSLSDGRVGSGGSGGQLARVDHPLEHAVVRAGLTKRRLDLIATVAGDFDDHFVRLVGHVAVHVSDADVERVARLDLVQGPNLRHARVGLLLGFIDLFLQLLAERHLLLLELFG